MITLNDATLNKVVTPIVEAYSNESYAARKIAPVVPVDGSDYAYRVWSADHLRYVKSVVGERGKAIPFDVNMSWTEDKTHDHFRELFIPQRILDKGAKAGIRYATEEAEMLAESMLVEEEYDLASVFTTGSNWTNKATPSTKWDTSGATPQDDVNTGINAIQAAVGRNPNTMMMTTDVFRVLVSEYVRSLDGWQAQGSKKAVLEYFGADCLTQLIVCSSLYNSVKKGQTKSLTGIWGSKNLWLGYVNPTPSRSAPSLASTFENRGGSFSEGEMQKNPKGQTVYVHRDYDQKVRNETAGYYLYTCLG